MINLDEAKNLNVYKKLVDVFAQYSDNFPATGVDKYLIKLYTNGLKCVPKDKLAQNILLGVLTCQKSVPALVQEVLNVRFADLHVEIRPQFAVGDKAEVAFWSQNKKVSDKVLSLIDFDLSGDGEWTDTTGKVVKLLKFVEPEKENKDA